MKLHIKATETRSVIDGQSTTGNVGRAGRRTGVFMDELSSFEPNDGYRAHAATQAVTNSRIFLSTPQGNTGAFYDLMHADGLDLLRMTLHWRLHPSKRPGRYRAKNGDVEILDDEYGFRDDYPFVRDDRERSPWYDRECRRCPVPELIAQEQDIDYLGSGHKFFDPETIRRLLDESVRQPFKIGDLDFDPESLKVHGLIELPTGSLRLWISGRMAARRTIGSMWRAWT